MKKLLFLFLLFPCFLQAQPFVVKTTRMLQYRTLWVANAPDSVIATLSITDNPAPAIGDTLFYDGRDWRWKKKFLKLVGKLKWTILPRYQQRVYNKTGDIWLESPDSSHLKLFYLGSDSIKTKP